MDAHKQTSEQLKRQKMSEKLTRERFHELLLAYQGAMNHMEWAGKQHGGMGSQEYKRAQEAAVKALTELEKAVFP